MLKAWWLWFVISKKYVEVARPKIESRDPIFFMAHELAREFPGMIGCFCMAPNLGPTPKSLLALEFWLVLDLDTGVPSWRQPLRVDGPKASQRSIITHKIHFCTDQAKTHREGRFWFDLSYDVTGVHRQMLRIKFCWFLFVFWRKLSHWDLVYKMAGCAARVT